MAHIPRNLRLFYAAPDVDYPGTHGGSTHVGEAVASLTGFCEHVYLLCKHTRGQRYIEHHSRLTIFRLPVPRLSFLRVFLYFFYPFFVSLSLILFRRVTVLYERARIFGGGAILTGSLLGKKTIYELIEPYITIPVLLGQVKQDSLTWKAMWEWHCLVTHYASLITITHPSSLEGIDHKRVISIHTGANPQKFKPGIAVQDLQKKLGLTKGKTLLYVGSFSPWHACDYLLRALVPVVKKDKKIKLLLLGSGSSYAASVRLAEHLGIMHHVLFLGKIPLAQVPRYINASDICLALFDRTYPPFKKLGYYYSPIKVHEYKACGKALLVSDYPLLRHLVKDGKNGYTVNETNIKELTAALQQLIRKPKLLEKMGRQNRKEVLTTYNWDYYNKLILERLFAF